MKRTTMLEMLKAVKEAEPPKFREVLRSSPCTGANARPGDTYAAIVCEAYAYASLSGQGNASNSATVDVALYVKRHDGNYANATDLTPAELRRLAEIREAVFGWRDGTGDWPSPKAGA